MPTKLLNVVLQRLRRAALRDGGGESDGQLLARFLQRRDDAALASLVDRHGPMVWSVCRRVLRNHHDAEDAFQAAFLVLVRKARSVIPREMLANWLYGVAHQTALKARATRARRQGRERQMATVPEPKEAGRSIWADLEPLLDEELARLPDKYRAAIVLCDLQGYTRREAAQQLRCPEGTVAARLSRGRAMLAKRLRRHGLVLTGEALAGVLAEGVVSASVPAGVAAATLKSAGLYVAGPALAAGVISGKVIALTDGVLKTMLLMKLKTASLIALACCVVGGAGVALHPQALAFMNGEAPAQNGQAQARVADPDQDKDKEKPGDDKAAALKVLETALAKVQNDKAAKNAELAKLTREESDLQAKIAALKAPTGPKVDFPTIQSIFESLPANKRPRDAEDTLGTNRANEWLAANVQGKRVTFEFKVDAAYFTKQMDGYDAVITRTRTTTSGNPFAKDAGKGKPRPQASRMSIFGIDYGINVADPRGNSDTFHLWGVTEEAAEQVRAFKGQSIPINGKLESVFFHEKRQGFDDTFPNVWISLSDVYIAGIKAAPDAK